MKKIIYALLCPITKDVHYIGKSTSGIARPKQHMIESHSKKISDWVDDLKSIGHKPDIKILEKISETQDIDLRERYWIQKYLTEGAVLLNSNLLNPILIKDKLDRHLKTLQYKDLSHISEFVKTRRKQIGISQEDFADKAGISLCNLRKVEQNTSNYGLDSLLTILSMFGCTIDIKKIQP